MRYSILALAASIPAFALISTGASGPERGLANRVTELEAQVEVLSAILQFVRVETEEINGLTGPHWIIEGVNVHVQSGSGLTTDGCGPIEPDFPNCESLTGLGNLIVGYNERAGGRSSGSIPHETRTGSHNLVVGEVHTYSSVAGFVAGSANEITSAFATVTGGALNRASGSYSSVSGGNANWASGSSASVSGGHGNVASGFTASVSGGEGREAPAEFNWVAGELLEPN
jgi:hypothetical protein